MGTEVTVNNGPKWKPTSKLERAEMRKVRVPTPGFQWNPLAKYPRNMACWCKSGVKSKRCCLPQIADLVKDKDAANLAIGVRAARFGRVIQKDALGRPHA
jgi:hypothetical protein